VHAAERSAAWEHVRNHRPGTGEFGWIADYRYRATCSLQHAQRALKQGRVAKMQEGFVHTHARTLTSGQQKSCTRDLELIAHLEFVTDPLFAAMEKHKS
jgi:hypothetical protein